MGGTALKHLGFIGKRISKSDYADIISEFTNTYKIRFLEIRDILHYTNKIDHGDIDFVALPKTPFNVKELFSPNFYSKNSCVHSFDYKGVQVDLAILLDMESFTNYYLFSCFSPLGNILGRMIKQTGLKWGIDGLTYPIKLSDSEQLGEIKIGTSACVTFEKLLTFMNLKPLNVGCFESFKNSFKDQMDIFDWASSSRFFNKDIFAFENLNHVNKKRDRLRKDYHNWLEFIKNKSNKFFGNEDKTCYIKEIDSHFGLSLNEEAEKLISKHTYKKHIKEKFNGKLVSEWTGLHGELLGKVIKTYKDSITNFENFVQLKHPKYIKEHFNEFYKKTFDL